MASALSLNCTISRNTVTSTAAPAASAATGSTFYNRHGRRKLQRRWGIVIMPPRSRVAWRTVNDPVPSAGSKADDSSASFEMSVERALELLGVEEGASFEDIVRAKNSIRASCKGDEETMAKVDAAYDMLLMQSLSQRRAGKVASSSVRYADVKPVRTTGASFMPPWLQSAIKNVPLSFEAPSTSILGIEAGIYGALITVTYVSGSSMNSAGSNNGADVPGLILATGFGVSLYFLMKKNVKLGKAAFITTGGLVVGALVGSAVENWLQVDVVPLFGIRSPAVIVSEFVLIFQLLTSLYLR